MWCGGDGVGVAEAPKDAELIVGRRLAEEELMRGEELSYAAGAAVKKMGCGGQGIKPKVRRDADVEQHCADAVVESAENALGAVVLWRRVRAG